MGMEKRQKEELKSRVRQEPIEEVVKSLGIGKKEAEHYLYKLWGREKYQRVVRRGGGMEKGGGGASGVNNFEWKRWLRENQNMLWSLLFIVLLLYLPFIGNKFLSDDIFAIIDDTKITSWSHVWTNSLAFIRPLYYFLISNLFGKVPAMFRLLNIVSHILMVGAVYLLVELLVSRRVAQVAAVLTAIHPIMIESVTWISGGAHSQYSLFAVISVIFYILARTKQSQKYYYWSVGSFLISLLFSEKAMMLPGLLVMYEVLYGALRKGKITKAIFQIWPYVGLSGVWLMVNISYIGKRTAMLASTFSSPVEQSQPLFQKVALSISEYLGLIFWPDKLTLYHSDVSNQWASMTLREVLLALLLIGLAGAVWLGWKGQKKWKTVVFCGAWFIITLIPTLTPWASAWIAAERYVYMGTVGVFVLIAGLWVKLEGKSERWRKVMWGIGAVAIVALMARTIVRNLDWRNQDYLWLSAERTSPSSPQNMNNLGDLYARRGDNEKAMEYFKRGIEINPGYADAHHNLANVYRMMGEIEEAKKYYLKAAELKPGLWQSWWNLALLSYQEKDYSKASEEIEQAMMVNPGNEELMSNAAIIYREAGEKEKASEMAQRILLINPSSQVARQVLGGE
ncbi:MAG: tetratricopeptide repeat protein [bacterium]